MIQWATNFLASTFLISTPIILVGLGIVFSERAGVINIGAEGLMLIGALMGVVGSWATGSVILGTLIAMLSGVFFSLIFAYLTVSPRANQVVAGLALNIFAGGFTVVMNRLIFGVAGNAAKIDVFNTVPIPLLKEIPIVGASLFSQPLPVYIALIAAPLLQLYLMRSNPGLKIRAVGENPKACDSLGISVPAVRYMTLLYAGAMAGFAGAFVSMGQVSFFSEGMIAGKGYMALAAVVFGNYNPVGVLMAGLVFGSAESLQYRLQASGSPIPYQFLLMLPYIITVLALCVYHKKTNRPAYSGQPYHKG